MTRNMRICGAPKNNRFSLYFCCKCLFFCPRWGLVHNWGLRPWIPPHKNPGADTRKNLKIMTPRASLLVPLLFVTLMLRQPFLRKNLYAEFFVIPAKPKNSRCVGMLLISIMFQTNNLHVSLFFGDLALDFDDFFGIPQIFLKLVQLW